MVQHDPAGKPRVDRRWTAHGQLVDSRRTLENQKTTHTDQCTVSAVRARGADLAPPALANQKTTPQKIDARQIHGEGRWRSVSRRRLPRDSGTRRSASAGLLTRFSRNAVLCGRRRRPMGLREANFVPAARSIRATADSIPQSLFRQLFSWPFEFAPHVPPHSPEAGDGLRPWRTRSPRRSNRMTGTPDLHNFRQLF